MKRLRLLLLAGLMAVNRAYAEELETAIVQSERAAELHPVLADMVAPEGGVSRYQDQLIIRATPAQMELVRDILKTLDRPLRSLRISVRTAQPHSRAARGAELDAEIHLQKEASSGDAALRMIAGADRDRASDAYAVTTLEGGTVFIATGSQTPYVTTTGGATGIRFQPAQNGIRVTPRLQADGQAVLELEVSQGTAATGGSIAGGKLQSRQPVKLGVWTPLPALGRSTGSGTTGIGARAEQATAEEYGLEILVEELP